MSSFWSRSIKTEHMHQFVVKDILINKRYSSWMNIVVKYYGVICFMKLTFLPICRNNCVNIFLCSVRDDMADM